MTYKEAHDWCLNNGATVFFHPSEALDNSGISTIGKVQFYIDQGGSAGDNLPLAVENWLNYQKSK